MSEQEKEEKSGERDFVAEATEMGWNAEYDGPDALDAKEFVLRKPLYDEMKKLRKKSRELESAVMAQKEMYAKQLEKERKDMLDNLKRQKMEAIEAGDASKVIQVEDRMEEVKKEYSPKAISAEFKSFQEDNSWYNEDEDMTAWADAYGVKQANKGRSAADIYADITRKVKDVFPHKFGNTNKTKPNAVESGQRGRTSKEDVGEKLSKEQKTIAETFWKRGVYGDVSRKEALEMYAKDYNSRWGDNDG